MNKKPKPWDQLYENLFIRCSNDRTFKLLSEWITKILSNADRLLKDAIILKDAERYDSACFLRYTASEEMAKSHILIDACRVDFLRHRNVLKSLCKAFYSHIAKYAYKTILSLPALSNMKNVEELWDNVTTHWWSSNDIESGEPDMPNETYFLREYPLYIDYYDQEWHNPQYARLSINISLLGYDISETVEDLNLLHSTHDAGLYMPESLSIINDIYKRHYINAITPIEEVNRIYRKVAHRIEDELNIPKEIFIQSAISKWALYHFVTNRGF